MRSINLLLLPLLTFFFADSKIFPAKNQVLSKHVVADKTVLLEYTGAITGAADFTVGAQIEMDTTIGFRYDVTFQNGTAVFSHIAIFYKFSSPNQTIYYNYLNHKTQVIKQSAGDPNNNVSVIGTENIDSFSCTHLQHASKNASEDYWMSTSVPGFIQLSRVLKSINPSLMAAINETIFNWGGLVRLSMVSNDPKGQTTFTLNLIEAKTGLYFKPTDFDVPSK